MWFDRIKYYYDKGYYTKEKVAVFVKAGYITAEQYTLITGEEYIAP